MIPARTFPSVFLKACHAKQVQAAGDVTLFDEQAPPADFGRPLIRFGVSKEVFTFSELGVDFKDGSGNAGRYSWRDLDFILPLDLSMANDKLYTFTDISRYVHRIALSIGFCVAWTILVGLIGIVIALFIAILIAIVNFIASLPTVLLILVLLIAIVFIIPVLITMIVGVVASISLITAFIAFLVTGGLIIAIAEGVAKLIQPFVERSLPLRTRRFKNGLCLIKEKWTKPPSGSETTVIIDFILIGIKLRRAALK
jgi:hypothetical protein